MPTSKDEKEFFHHTIENIIKVEQYTFGFAKHQVWSELDGNQFNTNNHFRIFLIKSLLLFTIYLNYSINAKKLVERSINITCICQFK